MIRGNQKQPHASCLKIAYQSHEIGNHDADRKPYDDCVNMTFELSGFWLIKRGFILNSNVKIIY